MRHSQALRGVLVFQSRREESLGVRDLAELLLTLVSHFPAGGENHLQVRLQQSSPTAICYGVLSPSLQSSCADIVDGMPYDFTLKRFGPSDDPRATVKLPLTLTSCTLIPCLSAVPTFWHSHTPSPQPPRRREHLDQSRRQSILTPPIDDGHCAMTISTLGGSDEAKWYDMWEAAVQLNGLCVREGKKGKNPAIGAKKRLSIDVRSPSGGSESGEMNNGTVGSGESEGVLNNGTADGVVGDVSTS